MSSKSLGLTFAFGLVVGVGTTALVVSSRSNPPEIVAERDRLQAEIGTATNQVAELGEQLVSAKARTTRLEDDNLKLANRVQALMKQTGGTVATVAKAGKDKPANPFAAMFGGDDSESGKAMKGIMEAAMKQQLETKLSAMKAKLNLSPDQESHIRALLEQQSAIGTELAQKMMAGSTTKEELADVQKSQVDPEAQIKALLSPEQLTAYFELQTEDRHNNARLMANSELLQMQGALGLSQEQQDKVFQALYTHTESQMTPPADGTPAQSYDPDAIMARKVEALKGTLTEEQLVRYKELQEQQMKLIKAFLPKNGGDAVPPTIVQP